MPIYDMPEKYKAAEVQIANCKFYTTAHKHQIINSQNLYLQF